MNETWDNIYQITLSLENCLTILPYLFKQYEARNKNFMGLGAGHGRDTVFLYQIVSMWKH